MTGHEQDTDLSDSTPDVSGAMGVSSERVGHAGPGQEATDGLRDNSEAGPGEQVAPGRARGEAETNPTGLPPRSGYPSKDPRSADHPYETP